jgi:acetyl esterase
VRDIELPSASIAAMQAVHPGNQPQPGGQTQADDQAQTGGQTRPSGQTQPHGQTQADDQTRPTYPAFRIRLYQTDLPAPHGVLLWFFGGAFRQGNLDFPSVDIINRTRAHQAGLTVVGVEYSLSPEQRYPVAISQGHAALIWLNRHATSLGLDPERIAIGGASSGANLAAAVALMNRDLTALPLRLLLLEVPTLDLTGGHLSRGVAWRSGLPPFLVARGLRSIALDYLGDADLADQPYASPLLAPDLTGLPPTHILTAGCDILSGDGVAYARRLTQAGVKAQLHQFAGLGHESSFLTAVSEPAQRWQSEVISILRSSLS